MDELYIWCTPSLRIIFNPGLANKYTGWLATLSWQSIVAADCYIVGGIVQGLIVVADPNYVPERWQATLLIIASAIGIGLFNIYGAKHLPLAEGIFATFHVFAFFPVVAVLWAMAPKQSARAVFVEFTDNGAGWPTTALAVMVGQVSSMFAVIGSDSVAHICKHDLKLPFHLRSANTT